MPSSIEAELFSPEDNEHSEHSNITGMTPRNIAIANKLIFWYLLTLQNSVTQTVKSAKAPWRTIAGKCSLLSLVTISKAEFATRSVSTFDAAENTPNIVRQPDRIFWTRAWIICCKHCRTYQNVSKTSGMYFINIPCLWSRGFDCEP